MNQKDRLIALETVNELLGVYQAQAESQRQQAAARRVGHLNDKMTQELEAAARANDAVVEKLAHVRRVVSDSMKRRRFSRKTQG